MKNSKAILKSNLSVNNNRVLDRNMFRLSNIARQIPYDTKRTCLRQSALARLISLR